MASVEWLLDQGGHFLRLGVMGIKPTRLQGERFENLGLKPTLKKRMHMTLCVARHSRENGNPDIHILDTASAGVTIPSLRLKHALSPVEGANGVHHLWKGR